MSPSELLSPDLHTAAAGVRRARHPVCTVQVSSAAHELESLVDMACTFQRTLSYQEAGASRSLAHGSQVGTRPGKGIRGRGMGGGADVGYVSFQECQIRTGKNPHNKELNRFAALGLGLLRCTWEWGLLGCPGCGRGAACCAVSAGSLAANVQLCAPPR